MKALALLIMAAVLSTFALGENLTQPNFNLTQANLTVANLTAVLDNITIVTGNITMPDVVLPPVVNFSITSVFPREFKVGDMQFNIQVQNTGEVELKNLMTIVSGPGFSSYDIVPIDSLKPGEKSYVIVMGNVRFEGNQRLMIRINDRLFYQNITVIDPEGRASAAKLDEMKRKEEEAKAQLTSLRQQLDTLKENYAGLESGLLQKQDEQFDVSNVKLEDLKTFLRDAESSIIVGDAKAANVSVTLAQDEYRQQKMHLDSSKKIKTSFMQVIKDNLIIISTMAGAVITLFSFYEIVKKKKDNLAAHLKSKSETAEKELATKKHKNSTA